MSQRLSDRLSFDQIGRRWAKENEKAAFGADDIAEDLVTAAESGEFEHPTHSREDAPPWKLTYKEKQKDGTVETKETEQPGVGPYRSPLSMRDGRSVNSNDIRNYIKARQTALGATDRETRRIVAREIFLSIEGLRRWCDESGFAAWAKLRGLSRPCFIELSSGDGAGQASAVSDKQEKPRKNRKRNVEADARRKARYEMVKAAERRKWPDPKKRPGRKPRAEELARDKKLNLGFSSETIRKILGGNYP